MKEIDIAKTLPSVGVVSSCIQTIKQCIRKYSGVLVNGSINVLRSLTDVNQSRVILCNTVNAVILMLVFLSYKLSTSVNI